MKRLLVFVLVAFMSVQVFGQNNDNDQKQTKQEIKEAKRQALIDKKQDMLQLLNNKTWVLEANTVYDRYGNSVPTSPTTNFIATDGENSVIQLAFPWLIGYNGLGGITFDDNVSSYKIYEGKKPTSGINVSLEVNGVNIGNATVNMQVSPDGYARATVIGNFGLRITYSGYVVPLEDSSIFQGQSLF